MGIEKGSSIPLYMQVKNLIINQIRTGDLKAGDIIPAELELCKMYGISRFPVRQAMTELVDEGYVERTRGKGTFVSKELPYIKPKYKNPVLGLVLGNLIAGFNGMIFSGFQKQAWKRGYFTVACCSEGLPDEEILCIDRLVENHVEGIIIFPCNNSLISSKLDKLKAKGVYLGLIDRNPGLNDIDYTGSDNQGGAYSAVRHIAMQGFRNIAFVSDMSNVSSINERLEGYLKAVEDFGMNAVTRININEDLSKYPYYMHRFFIEQLKEELMDLKNYLPLGIFAVNDGIAIQCINILENEGLVVGKDVGIVGFDNNPETQYMNVPLTTVAQNGYLIGKNAADIAIDKIEGKAIQVYKSIVPTQLIVRNSCGERGV
ncbi:MAG: GntR family transcriptional regulator [Firmicutes bacterium]|nr:GntR family transcriptional regulator [Bacillota bacterium]